MILLSCFSILSILSTKPATCDAIALMRSSRSRLVMHRIPPSYSCVHLFCRGLAYRQSGYSWIGDVRISLCVDHEPFSVGGIKVTEGSLSVSAAECVVGCLVRCHSPSFVRISSDRIRLSCELRAAHTTRMNSLSLRKTLPMLRLYTHKPSPEGYLRSIGLVLSPPEKVNTIAWCGVCESFLQIQLTGVFTCVKVCSWTTQ